MTSRKWFKHFSNASDGTMRLLIESGDQDAVFLYWVFLELLCAHEDPPNSGQAMIPWAVISKRSGFKVTRLRRLHAKIVQRSLLRCLHETETEIAFVCDKWRELQTSWGGKRKACADDLVGRSEKREERSEKIEIEKTKTLRARKRAECAFDLESVYNSYPTKKGKSRGMQRLAREIKTAEDFQALKDAVARYVQTDEVKRGFVKHWSTFANEWRDWTAPDAGTSAVAPGENKLDWDSFKERYANDIR